MKLQMQTWAEVETYLIKSRGIIIPIGSTEQHGPMGLIGTDALCPEIVADAVAEKIDVLVGPTISVGMAQHHLAFPGSITLRPTTLIATLMDYVGSLSRNGFERFYFLNGHGGNIATVSAAFSEIYAERSLDRAGNRPQIRCKLGNWFGFEEVSKLCKDYYGDRDGSHATASEISITQYAYPDHIKSMKKDPAPPRVRSFHDAEDYRAIHPDGRIGADSFLASPEHGRVLVETSAACIVKDYLAFLDEA